MIEHLDRREHQRGRVRNTLPGDVRCGAVDRLEYCSQLADVRTVYTPHGRTGDFRGGNSRLTLALYEQIRDQQQGFSGLSAFSTQSMNLSPGGEARYARALWVSGNFFDVLGVGPLVGRVFSPADALPAFFEPLWSEGEFDG